MKQVSHLVLGLALLAPTVVSAMPILSEAADGSGRFITILKDHENPKKKYTFPNTGAPMLNDRGEPRFALTRWEGGGYMSSVMQLAYGKEQQAAINEEVRRGSSMTMLPVKSSYISFMQDEGGERVMKEIFEEVAISKGGRGEDTISISAKLTDIGGKVLAAQVLSSGMATELKYCYTVEGVTPVFQGKIELDYYKLYKHFVGSSSGRWGWFKWNIRKEIERLKERNLIRITMTGGDAQLQDYLTDVSERLIKDFFVPKLQNRRIGSGNTMFSVGHIEIEEDRELVYELKQRKHIERDYCVGLGIDGIKEFPWLVTVVD